VLGNIRDWGKKKRGIKIKVKRIEFWVTMPSWYGFFQLLRTGGANTGFYGRGSVLKNLFFIGRRVKSSIGKRWQCMTRGATISKGGFKVEPATEGSSNDTGRPTFRVGGWGCFSG